MSLARAEEILGELWKVYGPGVLDEFNNRNMYHKAIIDEFFFVILGGFGITYEQNISGLRVLKSKGFIDSNLYRTQQKASETAIRLKVELNTPQFEPRTKAGGFRRYRFIETKPTVISAAGFWLWNECCWQLPEKIYSFQDSKARLWLCSCPGVGMKSASWLLRNIGLNDDCAVFDVHIMRFLNRIGISVPEALTVNSYLKLEETLRIICQKIGATLGAMDYLLWVLGRNGFLAYVR